MGAIMGHSQKLRSCNTLQTSLPHVMPPFLIISVDKLAETHYHGSSKKQTLLKRAMVWKHPNQTKSADWLWRTKPK